jgi:type III secretion protein U
MSQDSNEERKLPASPRKLRQARRKGQVARSRDAVMAAAVAAALLFLALSLPATVRRFDALLRIVGEAAPGPFEVALDRVWPLVIVAMAETLLPLLLVVTAAAAVAGVLVLRGPVLSFEPVMPRFERINPAQGMKRLFRLAQLVELLKSLTKTALLIALFLATAAFLAQSLAQAPRCGTGCLFNVAVVLFAVLAAGVVAVFALAAVADVPLQRQLFLREMRMTRTEQRRERRDVEGDPQIVAARRQRRGDIVSSASALGVGNASLLVIDPAGGCVGLRYISGETPAPVVVCRAEGAAAPSMITQARLLGIASQMEPELCRALLARKLPLGSFVPEELFRPAAAALLRAAVI